MSVYCLYVTRSPPPTQFPLSLISFISLAIQTRLLSMSTEARCRHQSTLHGLTGTLLSRLSSDILLPERRHVSATHVYFSISASFFENPHLICARAVWATCVRLFQGGAPERIRQLPVGSFASASVQVQSRRMSPEDANVVG